MHASPAPIIKDMVLIGGGHSHVFVLKAFAMKPMAGVRLTLVTRETHAPYSGMLPGLIAGHYTFDETHIDVRRLSRFAGATYVHDAVTGIDPVSRQVLFADRPPLNYDVLSINTGSTPDTISVPGAARHTIPVKPIDGFLARWQAVRPAIDARKGAISIGVVGAGAGGVELILCLHHALKAGPQAGYDPSRPITFHLISATDQVLATHNARVRAMFTGLLGEREIVLHTARTAERVEADGVVCSPGGKIALDHIFWVTAASAPKWLEASGLALNQRGFIATRETLQSVSHDDVFAAGDIAAVQAHPRPKSGVFAVRQGPPLADNLRRALTGAEPRPFRPQNGFLSLISTGEKNAVMSWGSLAVQGRWVWRWKDWIDRRFMDKFNSLPDMAAEEAPAVAEGVADKDALAQIAASAMRCGGCGAKVGADVLARVLDALPGEAAAIGPDSRDDAAIVKVPRGKLLVQSVDMFRAFIDDAHLFARIAANHALGDIYAMGAKPHSALAIATLPYGLEAKVEAQLAQLMSGALAMLHASQTALIGGHTSEGEELALGFAVNGFADPKAILRKAGLRPGDVLIVTKPIGTGILLAADMRLKAKGRWVDLALETMLQSSAGAARILLAHGASACTDVTGFGLAGHLAEMTRASRVGARLELDAVPVLQGAETLAGQGVFSSLQPHNIRIRRAIANVEEASAHPRYAILFDPQTAGGLLAGVPKAQAGKCLKALHQAGYGEAGVIGTVEPAHARGDAQITLTP